MTPFSASIPNCPYRAVVPRRMKKGDPRAAAWQATMKHDRLGIRRSPITPRDESPE